MGLFVKLRVIIAAIVAVAYSTTGIAQDAGMAAGVMFDFKQNNKISFHTVSPVLYLGLEEGPTRFGKYQYKSELILGPSFIVLGAEQKKRERMGFHVGYRYALTPDKKVDFYAQWKLEVLRYKTEETLYDEAYPGIQVEVPVQYQVHYIENSLTVGGSYEFEKKVFVFGSLGPALVAFRNRETGYDYAKYGLNVPTYEKTPGFVAMLGVRFKLD